MSRLKQNFLFGLSGIAVLACLLFVVALRNFKGKPENPYLLDMPEGVAAELPNMLTDRSKGIILEKLQTTFGGVDLCVDVLRDYAGAKYGIADLPEIMASETSFFQYIAPGRISLYLFEKGKIVVILKKPYSFRLKDCGGVDGSRGDK